MSQKFGTPIDLTGNQLKNFCIETVNSIPDTYVNEGREIIFQGVKYTYINGQWTSETGDFFFSGTYQELKSLKDNGMLVAGASYLLTDFRTTYLAEDGATYLGTADCQVIDHLGNAIVSDNYKIVLNAVSTNQFSLNVSILNEPTATKVYLHRMSEWVVQFNFDLDLLGRIIYMHDTMYNNTFDFDIFNVRWKWKGYEVNLVLDSKDKPLLNNLLEPNDSYYLWTIGDFGACYGSLFNPAEKYNGTVFYNISITQSSNIFIYAESKTIPSSVWTVYYFNSKIERCKYITCGREFFDNSFYECQHIYLQKWGNHLKMIYARYVFNPYNSRGLNIGFNENRNNELACEYLSFFCTGAAFCNYHLSSVFSTVFLGKKAHFGVDIKKSLEWYGIYRSAFINNNLEGTGAQNVGISFDSFIKNTEITIPDFIDKTVNFSIKSPGGFRCQLPIIEDLQMPFLWYKIFYSGNESDSVYLKYLNNENEDVNVPLTDATIINDYDVKFYENYIVKVNFAYYMPFCSFYGYATNWGYEIEETKYSTKEIYPIYACFFMNAGSNNTAFAGKTLKFYVELNDITYYSNSYRINSNGTLTKIQN